MAFDLLKFLSAIFGGLNIPGIEEKALAWLKEKGTQYPDLEQRTEALADWLTVTLKEASPELDPATMRNTIDGVAADIVHGTAGVDPGAWQGMG
jgi:hypothetical protein